MSIKMIVVKGENAYDMSELVMDVKWVGRRGSAARSLAVNFIDDDGYGHPRTGIDVEKGHQCLFYWKGKELFRGMFMRQGQSNSKTMSVIAYDNGIYLANNRDTFNYSNETASGVFKDCCKRFGIPCGAVANTSYKIPELPKPRTTAWDVICDALSITYKATGVRYAPVCVGDEMRLIKRKENVLQWVLETGVNIQNYSISRSIENVSTRIKLFSSEGKVLADAVNSNLEKKIGVFQAVQTITDEMNSVQLNELAKTMLKEGSRPDRSFPVSALGIPDVTTGKGVFIVIKELGIKKTFYVEEDSHTFRGNYHNMNLKLKLASDIED